MILTDYYLFKHLPDCTSIMRRDCVASTKSYPELEALRNKKMSSLCTLEICQRDLPAM